MYSKSNPAGLKKAIDKRMLANSILILFTLGFLVTFPWKENFFIAMACSFFSAAMIGGLADWFAITALFRRPFKFLKPGDLGLRMEIIPLNRERLFEDLTRMVTDELLTKENLKQRLSTLDLSKLLIDYLLRHGGIEGIRSIIAELVRDIIDKLDPQDVGGIIEEFIKRIVHRVKINPILAEGIEHSLKNGYDHKLIGFVADELIRILQQKPIVEVIKSTIVTSIQDYDRGSKLRQIIDRLFLNEHDRYAQTVQQKAIEFLLEVKANKKHSLRILLIERLETLLEDLRKSPELQNRIETWKLEIVGQKLNINQLIAEFIQTQKEAAVSGEGLVLEWLEQLKEVSQVWVERFEENEEHRGQFNAWVRSKLEAIIDKEHSQIGKLVRDNLDRYSNEELVSLLEKKVGSDLQMIRLNGSIVGGLLGIILFLINHVVEAVL